MKNFKTDNYKKAAELLNDKNFILWRIAPTTGTDLRWKKLIEENPGLEKEIESADTYLKQHIFNGIQLKAENKAALIERIQNSINEHNRRKRPQRFVKFMKYAALLTFIFLSGLLIYRRYIGFGKNELIVLNPVESRTIQLVSAGKSLSFPSNIDIQITKDIAIIQRNSGNAESISITPNTINKLIVPYGKRTKIELSDGSKLWLNSGSTLEFPSDFAKNKRIIHLKGEMYIEVEPDSMRPFYVHTPNFEVEVYGTKFNVSAYEHQQQAVALVEGSVGVKQKERAVCDLSPNEMVVYDKGFEKRQTDVLKHISWTKGYIYFDKTPLTEVLKHIERYYNVSLNYSKATNLKNASCKGKLYLSENLDNVMKLVALLSNTVYTKEDNVIYISNKPIK